MFLEPAYACISTARGNVVPSYAFRYAGFHSYLPSIVSGPTFPQILHTPLRQLLNHAKHNKLRSDKYQQTETRDAVTYKDMLPQVIPMDDQPDPLQCLCSRRSVGKSLGLTHPRPRTAPDTAISARQYHASRVVPQYPRVSTTHRAWYNNIRASVPRIARGTTISARQYHEPKSVLQHPVVYYW
eukprot:84664-Rhodomonas_salina.2